MKVVVSDEPDARFSIALHLPVPVAPLKARALVAWLAPSEGGRSSLPDGRRYVTIGKFPEDGPEWPDGAWSVVLGFDMPPSFRVVHQ